MQTKKEKRKKERKKWEKSEYPFEYNSNSRVSHFHRIMANPPGFCGCKFLSTGEMIKFRRYKISKYRRRARKKGQSV
jgi:hypothetical protein